MHLNYMCGISSNGWGLCTAKHPEAATGNWTMQVLISSMQADIWCSAKQLRKAWMFMRCWTKCQSTHGIACALWHTKETGRAQSSACHWKALCSWWKRMKGHTVARSVQTITNEHRTAAAQGEADPVAERKGNAAHAVWQAQQPCTHIGWGYKKRSAGLCHRTQKNDAHHLESFEGRMGQTAGVG